MSTPEILNTSRYNTEDVMAIVDEITEGKKTFTKIKIRHMIKPKTRRLYKNGGHETRHYWAKVLKRGGDYDLEICLLHPDKLGSNILDKIAFHDEKQAHEKVCSDLARALDTEVNYTSSYAAKGTELGIRLTEIDDSAKRLNAYRNLAKKVERAEGGLELDKKRLDEARQTVTMLENSIPVQENDLRLLKKRLEKQERDLRKDNLL